MRWLAWICIVLPLAGQTVRQWEVDGVRREALIHAPESARTRPSPLVFVFHGHGGNSRQAARSFRTHELWPEAIAVYPQGLPTPGRLTDPEGRRPGWQHGAGAQQDRDLKFYDVMLAAVKAEYRVDAKRVYATGHSNGGGFTYLLWAHRGATLAAVAPSGATGRREDVGRYAPKPVLHIAGEKDPLVKFSWQKAMIESLRKSNAGQPVETFIYDGGHRFPPEAAGRIVRFFQAR
jgi:polyhydroxybutyrate depolymerase